MHDNSIGIDALKRAGVDKNFIDSMYGKYGKYINKLGMSQDSLKNTINQLGNAVGDNSRNRQNPTSQKRNRKSGFDSGRYPKV